MSPSRPRLRVPLAVLGTVLLTGCLIGCDVRVDNPPPEIPSPDATEILRQQAAVEAQELVDLATGAAASLTDEPEWSDIHSDLDHITTDATIHLTDLGGIWTPPPRPEDPTSDPDPTDPTNPDPTGPAPTAATTDPAATAAPDPAAAVLPEDVLEALDRAGASAPLAAGDPAADADLATLLASIAINRALLAEELRLDLGLTDSAAASGAATPTLPETFGEQSSALCRTLDALGYVNELIAARSEDETRSAATEAAVAVRDQAEQIAVAAGYDGTDTDPREPVYAVDTADLPGARDALLAELLPGWLAQVADAAAEDRPALIELATRAAFAIQDPDQRIATYPGLG